MNEPLNGVELDEAELARVLHCSTQSVRNYLKAGIIQRGANGKFPAFETTRAVVEHLRSVAGRLGIGDAAKINAALKDAQRRLTETKLAQLDGRLLSMMEIEAVWSDLAAAAKWLFLSLPRRARMELGIDAELEGRLQEMCVRMLREVAFTGQIQITDKPDAEEEDNGGEPAAAEPKAAR